MSKVLLKSLLLSCSLMEHKKYDKAIFTGSRYKPFFDHWKQVREQITAPFCFNSGTAPDGQATRQYAVAEKEFSRETRDVITGITAGDHLSAAVVCLSAINQLLARYSRTDTVVVNTPLYQVTTEEDWYADEVVLCQRLDWKNTIRESVLKLKEIVAASYTHQNFPLETAKTLIS